MLMLFYKRIETLALVLTTQPKGKSHLQTWLLRLHHQHLNGRLTGENVASVNKTREKNLSHLQGPYKPEQDGYTNISTNVPLFQAINALPIMLDPARLNEEGGKTKYLMEGTSPTIFGLADLTKIYRSDLNN